MTSFLLLCAQISIPALTVIVVIWLAGGTPETFEPKGERGQSYRKTVEKWSGYKYLYRLTRVVSKKITPLMRDDFSRHLNDRLKKAGTPWGFGPNELVSLSLLLSITVSVVLGTMTCHLLGFTAPGAIAGFFLGISMLYLKIDELGRTRIKQVLKQLPASIEMISLCMKAGMDFQGALKNVSSKMEEENPLKFEFDYLAGSLALGSSMSEALIKLAYRVDTPEMERFVSSVNLGLKMGTPLSETLSIQATVMRTRRSQKAEQAATRASLLMLGPLMLIFISVFILLLGPFLVDMVQGDLL